MSEGINKQKIEAIFPLSTTQQGLLFHSLSSNFDQGFLNLQCDLRGSIDPDTLRKAWNLSIQRHAILRTTVHWEKIEKPVQIVHRKKEIDLELLDCSALTETEIDEHWESLKNQNREDGVDFTKGALLKVKIVQFGLEKYRLLWTNHHLLLDGWSSNIILKEVFSFYEALTSNVSTEMEPLPSYKSYLRWVSQKKPEDAKIFWTDYFSEFRKSHLFYPIKQGIKAESITIEKSLSEYDTDGLKKYAKQSKVTLNTVIQGIWSLVLCTYFDSNDVVHGTTVSGRTSDFVNMEMLTGMYSKVHPVRNFIDNDGEMLSDWFDKIQKRQTKTSSFEYLDLEDLIPYLDKDVRRPLFDSLLIFENYPVVDTSDRNVAVTNFKSGITSTYPITVTILPGSEMHLVITVSESVDNNKKKAEWLFLTFNNIVKSIISDVSKSVSSVISELEPFLKENNSLDGFLSHQAISEYVAPRNETEKKVTEIWSEIFGINEIGINDNFFSLGGKSMLAVKLFAAINAKMGTKLYPTTLMEYPTIASLTKLLTTDVNPVHKYVVPIQSKGGKHPLFCVHGGGAHVFFFNPLANAMSSGRPVYALQPQGIYDSSKMHRSIKEMAEDYADEIRKIQPKGPYNLLVYCFSTAVGIEMASSFKKAGQETNMIIIDSLIDQEDFTDPNRIKLRIKGFLSRVAKNPFKAIKMGYINHVEEFFKRKRVDFFGSEDERKLEKVKRNLIEIYNAYDWKKKYTGKIALLLTQKDDKTLNDVYIKLWEQISEREVKIVHIEGQHHQLFEEPFVVPMAQTIDELMA